MRIRDVTRGQLSRILDCVFRPDDPVTRVTDNPVRCTSSVNNSVQPQRLRAPATAFVLVALCATAVMYATHVPAPRAAFSPASAFSAQWAMRHVMSIAQSPHPTGSEEHARVRAYLRNELALLGLTPQVQEATGVGTRYAVSGRVRNVLARVPGRTPGGLAVLLMAHYDGVPAGPAAGDDASGSAVLLETVRALRSSPPLEHDVIVLFTDGEEPGLLGAAAFVREHPWAKDVGVVLNFEARGTRGPSLMFETGAGNLDVVRVLRRVSGVRATSLSTAVYRRLPNDTDLSELAVLDKPAMNFAFIGGAERYHTAEDDITHLARASIQHHGDQALALARAFGNGPLPRPRTSDAVFFNAPIVGLIVYPDRWAVPLAIMALALVVAAVARLRKSEQRWLRDVSLGVLGLVISVVATGMLGFATGSSLRGLHELLPGGGAPEWSGTYAAALTLLAFAITALCYAIVRLWASASGAHVGALLGWAIVSLFIAWWSPGMSFLFTWPILAVAIAESSKVAVSRASIANALTWASTIVAIFVVVPTVYIMVCMALGLGEMGGTILAGFTSLTVWLVAPHLESLHGARLMTTPALAASAALALFVFGVVTVRTNARHPGGVALVYAVDSDSNTAWLTGYGSTASSRAWLARALRQSAVGRPAGAPPQWLGSASDAPPTIAAPMPPVVPQPTATVVSDTSSPRARHVTLRIRPGRGMRALSLATDSGVVLSAAVDGRPIDTKRYRTPPTRWTLDYIAPPDSGFTIALTLRPGTRPVLELTGRLDGIPALKGFSKPQRPPGIVPFQAGERSLVLRRVRL